MNCHLWITRVNAVTCENGGSHSYSRLMLELYKRQLHLNYKIPVQIAISNRDCLDTNFNEIIKKGDWEEFTGIL